MRHPLRSSACGPHRARRTSPPPGNRESYRDAAPVPWRVPVLPKGGRMVAWLCACVLALGLTGCLDTELPDFVRHDAADDAASRDGVVDGGPACQHDEDCTGRPETPLCDPALQRCVACLLEDHIGCGADALCCDSGGRRACRPTDPSAGCAACDEPCGRASDTCSERMCGCGGRPAPCGGAAPVCAEGRCVACAVHTDCGPAALCCGGSCVATSFNACTDCGESCDPSGADTCVGRQCRCGAAEACAGERPHCFAGGGGQVRCLSCALDEHCGADPNRGHCVAGTCAGCDATQANPCPADAGRPICGADNTCQPCQNDRQCADQWRERPFCLVDGSCRGCRPGSNEGCSPEAPFCDDGVCRPCSAPGECGSGVCLEGRCADCNPETNTGCPREAPICTAEYTCVPCSREVDPAGQFVGDEACSRGRPEGAFPYLCTARQTCALCDSEADHRGCGLDTLCCPDTVGIARCVATADDREVGCEACGVACDPALSNHCADRHCRCGAGEACTPPLLCDPLSGQCVRCRVAADCRGGACVQGVCVACNPANNEGCPPEAPICNPLGQCMPCGRAEVGGGARDGDAACNRGRPLEAPPLVCTAAQTCATCDPGEDHRGCALEALCCAGADGASRCVPAEAGGGRGCEQCGVPCDAELASACVGRRCVCGATGEACVAPQTCQGVPSSCQN